MFHITGSQNDELSLQPEGTEFNGKCLTQAHVLCSTKREPEVGQPGQPLLTVTEVTDSMIGNVIKSLLSKLTAYLTEMKKGRIKSWKLKKQASKKIRVSKGQIQLP